MKGGRPPKDQDTDEIMVDRIVKSGMYAGCNRAEMKAAVLILVKEHPGWSYNQIARCVGVNPKTIQRIAVAEGWPTRHIVYDPDVVHQKLKEALERQPFLTVAELCIGLEMGADSIIKYTRSAIAAGILAPEQQRRNRVKVKIHGN